MTIVVPCYNEAARLNFEEFQKSQQLNIRVLFVDDGSTDGTGDLIEGQIVGLGNCRLLRQPHNGGKGSAVRAGMLAVTDSDWFASSTWIGYWDADLSTPLTEVDRFIDYEKINPGFAALWGSRVYRLGSTIRRSAKRHYLGRIFATLIYQILDIHAYDTQCGAKLFRPEVITKVFREEFISRWIFDVEVLLRLHQTRVLECPVSVWQDVSGSKIRILSESFRVLFDLIRIRLRYRNADSR